VDRGDAPVCHFLKQSGWPLPGEPGKQGKVREFKSGQEKVRGKKEKSGKMSSCIWSVTASIDLDAKCAKKGIIY